jgi:hypothetical protein
MRFKKFLLTEQRNYFSHRVGDVLTSVHELIRGGKQIGARQLVRHSQVVVNQIRKILHTSWPKSEYKYLVKLQKCGVALAKCIDEKGDLRETLNGVRHEIERLVEKIGNPINTLAAPEMEKNDEEPKQKQPAQPDNNPTTDTGAGTQQLPPVS